MDGHTIFGKVKVAWVVAAALVAVGLVALGVPLASLLFVGVLLLCPLMMMGMHGGAHGGHGSEQAQPTGGDARPTPLPRHGHAAASDDIRSFEDRGGDRR